jgi:hypothetical protein
VTRRSYLIDTFGRSGGRFQVLELAAGASRGAPERNRPPAMVHVVVEAGEPRFLIPLGPAAPSSAPLGELIHSKRSQAVSLGRVRWGGRRGTLTLAESFPGGGAHGDHLVFRWHEAQVTAVLSLHVWAPASETRATLEALVESID